MAQPTKQLTIKEKAREKLQAAYTDALSDKVFTSKHKKLVDYVIDGTHLTYKYVLFNALLSKATDVSLNPLCLQKKSVLPGSFDARTVCHKVIVPFEQTTLKKVLGGSNEPFLNKPARYTDLSKDNAVRRGKDQDMLFRLCDELPHITSSNDAYDGLVYLLRKLIKLRDENEKLTIFNIPESSNLPIKLIDYCFNALRENYEGEVLTLIVAGIYHLLYKSENALVEVHPVNQSGASSKEVSDLDIYINSKLVISNELKDKEYSESDVRHAADKVLQAGGDRMFFIEGPRGKASSNFPTSLIKEYAEKNFALIIIPCNVFIMNMVPLITDLNSQEFVHFILYTAHETKFKEEVIAYMNALAEQILNLSRE